MLYIAYGSNMHLPSMALRCPTATVVGNSQLKGYDLIFRGVATVEPAENGAVPVVVWEISEQDERRLDAYEGYPSFYRKEEHQIELNGKNVNAMVYVMNDGHPYREPSSHYLNTIREGYETAGFDMGYLDKALGNSITLAQIQDLYAREMLMEEQESQDFDADMRLTP